SYCLENMFFHSVTIADITPVKLPDQSLVRQISGSGRPIQAMSPVEFVPLRLGESIPLLVQGERNPQASSWRGGPHVVARLLIGPPRRRFRNFILRRLQLHARRVKERDVNFTEIFRLCESLNF